MSKGALDLNVTHAPAFAPGERHFLAIAIDDYAEAPLYNCVSDAEAVAKALVAHYGFLEANLRFLRNAEASRANIYRTLEDYADSLEANDSLVVYFSGHGQWHEKLKKGYWIPGNCQLRDFSSDGIPNEEIRQRIALQKARHVLLLVDSCFAGSLFAQKNAGDHTAGRDPHNAERFKSRWAITAGRREPVSDGKPGDRSPFAQKLLQFLEKDGPERFTAAELGEFVMTAVGRNAQQQPDARPLQNAGDDGGRLVFYRKDTERPDTLAFQRAKASGNPHALELFIGEHPQSPHKAEAKQALKALREQLAWQKAEKRHTIDAYDDYLEEHPEGAHAEEAKERIKQLTAAKREEGELAEVAARKQREEAEAKKKRLAEEAAQKQREQEEAEKKRLAEVAAQKQREQEEAEKKRLAKVAAQKQREQEEAEKMRLAEAVTQKQREQEESEKKRLAEAAAQKQREQEEAEKMRLAEAVTQKQREQEESEKKRLAEAAAQKQREQEEAEKMRLAETEARKQREREEAKLQVKAQEDASAWIMAEQENTEQSWMFFIQTHSDSPFLFIAQKRLEALKTARLTQEADAAKRLLEKAEKKRLAEEAERRRLVEEADNQREREKENIPLLRKLIAARQRELEEAERQRKAQVVAHPKNGDIHRDAPTLPAMVFVQGGTFQMGSNLTESEKPIHEVALPDFFISQYPVTFEEYDAFCVATQRKKPADEGWGRGKRPVINVNWDDATAFCEWLSKQTGKSYRLPTEAEWEYAARGGALSEGFEYAGSNNLDEVGWHRENAGSKTHPVGEKKSNELGLYDFSGNVWEWCGDWYAAYPASPVKDYRGPAKGSGRTCRGGSWSHVPQGCRAAYRSVVTPSGRSYSLGFRPARTP